MCSNLSQSHSGSSCALGALCAPTWNRELAKSGGQWRTQVRAQKVMEQLGTLAPSRPAQFQIPHKGKGDSDQGTFCRQVITGPGIRVISSLMVSFRSWCLRININSVSPQVMKTDSSSAQSSRTFSLHKRLGDNHSVRDKRDNRDVRERKTPFKKNYDHKDHFMTTVQPESGVGGKGGDTGLSFAKTKLNRPNSCSRHFFFLPFFLPPDPSLNTCAKRLWGICLPLTNSTCTVCVCTAEGSHQELTEGSGP